MSDKIDRESIATLISNARLLSECLVADKLAEEANRDRARQVDLLKTEKGWTQAEYEAADRDLKAALPRWLDTKDLSLVCIQLAKGGSEPGLLKILNKLKHNAKFLESMSFWMIREELKLDAMQKALMALKDL